MNDFLAGHFPVEINGKPVEGSIDRVKFLRRTLRNSVVVDNHDLEPLPAAAATRNADGPSWHHDLHRVAVAHDIHDDILACRAVHGLASQIGHAEDALTVVADDFVTRLQAGGLSRRAVDNARNADGGGAVIRG